MMTAMVLMSLLAIFFLVMAEHFYKEAMHWKKQHAELVLKNNRIGKVCNERGEKINILLRQQSEQIETINSLTQSNDAMEDACRKTLQTKENELASFREQYEAKDTELREAKLTLLVRENELAQAKETHENVKALLQSANDDLKQSLALKDSAIKQYVHERDEEIKEKTTWRTQSRDNATRLELLERECTRINNEHAANVQAMIAERTKHKDELALLQRKGDLALAGAAKATRERLNLQDKYDGLRGAYDGIACQLRDISAIMKHGLNNDFDDDSDTVLSDDKPQAIPTGPIPEAPPSVADEICVCLADEVFHEYAEPGVDLIRRKDTGEVVGYTGKPSPELLRGLQQEIERREQES